MPESKSASGLRNISRALKYRNYRLFFMGQGISLIGTWMQRVAAGWLVYRLSGSPFLLGVVGFAGQLPMFLLAPIAGVVADRRNRHRMVILTQILSMVQAAILAVIVLTGIVRIWHIVVLAGVLGIINAFDMPTRQSFVVEMIDDKQDLGNAIALNSTLVNFARLVGPSVAGFLIAVAGEGLCFSINAISYLTVIAALLAMRIPPRQIKPAESHVLAGLKEGFKYSLGNSAIRSTLILLAVVSLFGMPYMVLMPVFAKDVLGGGPHTYGLLMGSTGFGALAGALYLASRRGVLGMNKLIAAAATLFGVGLVAFSISRYEWLSMAFLFFAGMGMMLQMATSNTSIQIVVDDDKRARVMGFFALSFLGMAPFGNLLEGAIADRIGAPITVMVSGFVCVIGALTFAGKIAFFRRPG